MPKGTVLLPRTEESGPGTGTGESIVIVYDNDHNTIDEVISILMSATACTRDEAVMETWEVHHLGKSVVHHASREECQRVAAIIASIGIRVEVREM